MLLKKLLITFCVMALVVGCSNEQPTSPVVNEDVEIIGPELTDTTSVVEERKDGPLAAASSASTWPRSLWDFKFPYRYGERWKITCGYGCYKHKNTYYPGAGFYSVDLVRVYHSTTSSCVLAPARGVVVFAGWMSGYGWCVVMDHDKGHTGQGYKSIVAHLKSNPTQFVRVGNDLLAGTILGYAGKSGTETPHIHFSVWKHNRSVSLNGISGHRNLYVGTHYFSYNWPRQPPYTRCSCR